MESMNSLSEMLIRLELRRVIQGKIDELQKLVDEANDCKDELSDIDEDIGASCEDWKTELSNFEASEMSEIVVINKYEGTSAEAILGKLPAAINEMQNTSSEAAAIQGEIATQLEKLDKYIEPLEEQIDELKKQLAEI